MINGWKSEDDEVRKVIRRTQQKLSTNTLSTSPATGAGVTHDALCRHVSQDSLQLQPSPETIMVARRFLFHG